MLHYIVLVMGNNTVTVDVTHIVTDYVTDFVIANIQFCTRIWTINWPVFTIFIYPDAEGFCSDVLCLFIFYMLSLSLVVISDILSFDTRFCPDTFYLTPMFWCLL